MIYHLIDNYRDLLANLGLYRFLQVFRWPEFRTLLAIISSFFFIILTGKPVILWLMKQKIGDAPEFYNATLNELTRNKKNTPTMGGILIVGSILLATLLLADLSNFYVRLALVCVLWYAAIGGFDDWLKLTTARRNPGSREGLYAWEKLLFQIGGAMIIGFFAYYYGSENPQTHILNLPGQRTFEPGTSNLNPDLISLSMIGFGILTVFVITGSSNAVNLTDGMDGLASGVMSIVAFAFIILTLITGIPRWATFLLIPNIPGADELAVVAGSMVGACLGFLWFNCHPAQVFMGDTGSLALGALIGYIAVVVRQEFLLFIIGGIFVIEAVSVMLQVSYFRFTGGSRIFRCTPIHHHFHLGGWTEQQVVVRFWLITALLAVIALATLKLR